VIAFADRIKQLWSMRDNEAIAKDIKENQHELVKFLLSKNYEVFIM
jgi:hypothetical protein